MAATTETDKTEPTDHVLNPLCTGRQDSGCFSADSGELQDYVVDFLEKEVGSDLKSLKNVGNLLEKLREETNVLEKQVNDYLDIFSTSLKTAHLLAGNNRSFDKDEHLSDMSRQSLD